MDEKKVSIDQLVLYRNLKYGGLFREMAALMGAAKTGTGAEPDPFSCAGQLVELAAEHHAQWYTAGARSKQGGHPHHPLYLRRDSRLEPFDAEGYCAGL